MIFYILFFQILQSTYAFKVSPIELNFKPTGRESVQTISLENTSDQKIPIEIEAYSRKHENGKEVRTKTQDFHFFPPKLILNPKEKRSVRINWLGERDGLVLNVPTQKGNTKLNEEKAYRLQIRQVPVDLLKKNNAKTGINFLYNYVASLYVKPENAKPNIEVLDVRKSKEPSKIDVSLKNLGQSHDILAFYEFYLEDKVKVQGQDVNVVKIKTIDDVTKGINLLPSELRVIDLTLPNGLSVEDYNVKIKRIYK